MSKLTKERIAVMRRSHSFSATPAAEFNALCDLALSALEREEPATGGRGQELEDAEAYSESLYELWTGLLEHHEAVEAALVHALDSIINQRHLTDAEYKAYRELAALQGDMKTKFTPKAQTEGVRRAALKAARWAVDFYRTERTWAYMPDLTLEACVDQALATEPPASREPETACPYGCQGGVIEGRVMHLYTTGGVGRANPRSCPIHSKTDKEVS